MKPIPHPVFPGRWLILASRLFVALLVLRTTRSHAADDFRFPVRFEGIYRLEGTRDGSQWDILEPSIIGRAADITRPRSLLPAGFTEARLVPDAFVDLDPMLEKLREKHHLPGLAAIVIRSNRVLAAGAVGVRVEGTDAPVMLGDVWHHGSLTKSMTATLAGMLVEEGRIRWDTTLGDILGTKVTDMHPGWRPVTLSQLLRHRAGAPDHDQLVTNGVWRALWRHRDGISDKRTQWLRAVTTNAPVSAPGTKYLYSNTGYVFAGMMLESVTGKSWEDLMRERLFAPLSMDTAGFGPPGTPGRTNQPWGHQWIAGVPVGTRPGPNADNPPALGPAGTMHGSLFDLAKYLMWHARRGSGPGPALLRSETFRQLHTPEAGETYAFGWAVSHRPWAGGKALNHTGSNTQWFSNAWVAPEKQAALLVLTNIGDGTNNLAFKATDAVLSRLVSDHLRR